MVFELSQQYELDGTVVYNHRRGRNVVFDIHALSIPVVACASLGIRYDYKLGAVYYMVLHISRLACEIHYLESWRIKALQADAPVLFGDSNGRVINRRIMDRYWLIYKGWIPYHAGVEIGS